MPWNNAALRKNVCNCFVSAKQSALQRVLLQRKMNRMFPLRMIVSLALFSCLTTGTLLAQHCSDATVPDTGASAKIRAGGGFQASYSLPCIQQGVYTEVAVPFQVFNTVPRGNSDDVVAQMRIDNISNLPAGMCWVTNKADNVFQRGEGGLLMLRGIASDNVGQFALQITLSFDTNGEGTFNRTDVNYNKVSNTGRMILRVVNPGEACPDIDYDLASNIAASGTNTALRQ